MKSLGTGIEFRKSLKLLFLGVPTSPNLGKGTTCDVDHILQVNSLVIRLEARRIVDKMRI